MPIADEHKTMVMHSTFVSPALKFMASDGRPGSRPAETGNITMSLATKDIAEGERVFAALAAGGTVEMPLADAFWGARFGLLTDRYGIAWMLNCYKA